MQAPGIPSSTVNVALKRVNLDLVHEEGRQILDLMFPGFRDPRQHKPWIYDPAIVRASEAGQVLPPWDARRFAGDNLLPRARYYSLSHDEGEDDDATLANEVLAYADPYTVGAFWLSEETVTLADGEVVPFVLPLFTAPWSGRVLVIELPTLPPLFLLEGDAFIGEPTRENPLTALLERHDPCPTRLWVPLQTVRERIDGVVDLRIPDAAQWFAAHFSRLEHDLGNGLLVKCFPYRRPLRHFHEVLPLVLSQELGGGLFHMLVGNWLRRHGVQALIYPSARSDPEVRVRWGRVTSWKGWNLVDYRGAPPPVDLFFTSGATYWPRRISLAMGSARYEQAEPTPCDHVGIRRGRAPWSKGSWKSWGLADRIRHEVAMGMMSATR